MKKLAEFVIRYRWAVIVFFLALTAFMGYQMKNARFNPDLLTYLPEDLPSRVHQKQIEKLFGGTEMVMIVVQSKDVIASKTLERVEHFSQDMQNIKGIERVMSVFEMKNVRSENDAMTVDPAVKMIPHTPEEAAMIKKELSENDLVYGSVVSKDFTTTAVIGLLEPGAKDKPVIDQVEAMIAKYPGAEKVLLGGSPYMRMQNGEMMQKDMARLIPLGLVLMMIFLFISFRQFRGVWLPILIVIMSIFTALGATPLLGWEFAVTTIILVVLLIATANSYGIHMFARYQRDNYPGNTYTTQELSKRMVTSLGAPIILSGFTTIAGLLCMLGHVLIPGGQMGVLGSIGIAVALIGSLLFIPAVSSVLRKTKPKFRSDNNQETTSKGLDRALDIIGQWVTLKPKTVLLSFAVVSLIGVAGLFLFKINSNPAKLFPDGHPAKESAEIINKELGGFFPLCVVFDGDMKDPVLLKKIDELEKKIVEIPEVGTTQSIAKVTRQISRALYNKGEEGYDKIPGTYDAASQYFELYLMSGSQRDLEKMVDFNFEKALLMVRFKELNTPVLRRCVAQIKDMVKNEPDVKIVGGNADVFSDMDKHVVDGQFFSLFMSLLVVFVIISIGFKSFKAGLLQIVPLIFAVLMLFGLMGYFGIELNFMTAFQASILIGVGVDYTIHVVWRFREEKRLGYDDSESVRRMFKATGRGIVFNALAVIIGFVALLFSGFLPVRFFGILMVTIIFVCLIGAVLLVPVLCMVLKPKFLEKKTGKKRICCRRYTKIFRNKKTINKSKSMSKLFLSVAIFAVSAFGESLFAQGTFSPQEVQHKSIQAVRVCGLESQSSMTIYSPSGDKRVRKMEIVSKLYDGGDLEKKLIRFLEPADVKGTGFLSYDYLKKDDDKWIYMPALRKTRRIVSSENAKSFMGSEFSYADMSVPTVEDYNYKFLTEERVNGHVCYVLEIIPKDKRIANENGFSKKISCIDKSTFVVWKAVYYNLAGEKEKEMTVSSIEEVDTKNQKYRFKEMIMTNLKNGRKSVLNNNNLKFSPSISDARFTTRELEQGGKM